MSPRAYRTKEGAPAEASRTRIVAAAREILEEAGKFSDFSMESVARRADVSRLTVYYQFGSKLGLLEAVFNDMADRGGLERLPSAFAQPDAVDALREFIAVFGRFWSSERLVFRRIRALASLDYEFDRAIVARDARRLEGARVIMRRLSAQYGRSPADDAEGAARLLYAMTSFAFFDSLAGSDGPLEDAIPLVQRFMLAALGLSSS